MVGTKVVLVAPGTTWPPTSQRTPSVSGAGVPVAASRVSGEPTAGVPETVGAAVEVSEDGSTSAVDPETAWTADRPVPDAVTRTDSALPTRAAVGVRVRAVAPLTGTPSASHW